MLINEPVPFAEAIELGAARGVLPMELNSAQYRRLSSDLKRRAAFSARVTNAEILQTLNDLTVRIVGGVTPEDEARRAAGTGPLLMDVPQAKALLRQFVIDTGYEPEKGKEGTIEDLTSDPRINVMLETNIATVQGYGQWKNGQNAVTLDLWPAWELFRLVKPQGKERDWHQRWIAAGGQIIQGRMVALKNDPIWQRLGDPDLFPDGLGNPYPPFAFNSGMDVREISRDEAINLGLMQEDEPGPEPQDLGINDDLHAQAGHFSSALQSALAADPDLRMVDGVLELAA